MMYTKQTNNFDYSLLRKRMVEYRYNITSLAAAVGMDKGLLGAKLRNRPSLTNVRLPRLPRSLILILGKYRLIFLSQMLTNSQQKLLRTKLKPNDPISGYWWKAS